MKTVNEKLTEQGIKTDNITWIENVPVSKQSHYWYGGEVCTIQKDDKTVTIEANGNINARLIEKESGRERLYVKDKNSAGELGHKLSPYIKSDSELIDALLERHDTYVLIMDDGNCYEGVITKNGQFVDSFVFDGDTIEECIKNVTF